MRLNRTHKRPLEFSRGPADRDPMFAAHWYGVDDVLPRSSEPVLVPVDPELLHLLPEPAIDDSAKWEHVIAIANDVNAVLKGEADFDGKVLVGVVCGLIDSNPTSDDIIAAYRKRMEAKRDGR